MRDHEEDTVRFTHVECFSERDHHIRSRDRSAYRR